MSRRSGPPRGDRRGDPRAGEARTGESRTGDARRSAARRGGKRRDGETIDVEGPLWIGGVHAVRAALETGRVTVLALAEGRRDARVADLEALAAEHDVTVERVPRADLEAHALGNHQGVAARVERPRGLEDDSGLETILDACDANDRAPLLLVLEGVTDPRNLGACLRSADAAGADAVLVPRSRTAPLTAAARKTASGAAESVPVVAVANLARTLRWLGQRGVRIAGLAGEATAAPWAEDLAGPLAIVMGAEGEGLRRLTREHCDVLIALPMAGTVDSLNVSVAAGIALFDVVRQREARRRAAAASPAAP